MADDPEGVEGAGEEGEEEEEWESEDSWESDLDSEAEIAEIMQLDLNDDAATTGKKEYLEKCKALDIVPIAMFIAKLDCEHVNLCHHGMGVKGALALAAALSANYKIRSLNLSDNWLGNEGVHAVAGVLTDNTTLTSLNLSDNRLALPGTKALCRRLPESNTLAEISLRANNLDDRAATFLAEALQRSPSLTKVDLSYNSFGEEAGRRFAEMLSGHRHLLDVDLKWNSLRAKGGIALAEALKSNDVLNKLDLGWNGLGDVGCSALGDMLGSNAALTHLDVSHNRIQLEGAVSLAEGLTRNAHLMTLELGFNPMGVHGMHYNLQGVEAIVGAIRAHPSIQSVGLTNVQTGGNYTRGRASRFDPQNPDGHYALDMLQPWDRFISETLHARMSEKVGESWINVTLNGTPLQLPAKGAAWEPPNGGTLELDYVTWKRGLEATFDLDLSSVGDAELADHLLARTQNGAHGEALRECRLNDAPFEPGPTRPAKGVLHAVYFSTKQQDELLFPLTLDMSLPHSQEVCLRLWQRSIATPSDEIQSAVLGGNKVDIATWKYPSVPKAEVLELTYSVRLSIKPYDRGVHFSSAMEPPAFRKLLDAISAEDVEDAPKVELLRQVAARNYLTAAQVKELLVNVSTRKPKLEVAVLLHPRTVDAHNFVNVLQCLTSEVDRQAVLEMVESNSTSKQRRH